MYNPMISGIFLWLQAGLVHLQEKDEFLFHLDALVTHTHHQSYQQRNLKPF